MKVVYCPVAGTIQEMRRAWDYFYVPSDRG